MLARFTAIVLAASSFATSMRPRVTALADKISALAGDGKLAEREWRVRVRCGWHRKAKTMVRHLLHFERRPSHQEAQDIEAAYARYCAEKIEKNRAENADLLNSIVSFAEIASRVDADFYSSHLEALRESLLRLGLDVPPLGGKDKPASDK